MLRHFTDPASPIAFRVPSLESIFGIGRSRKIPELRLLRVLHVLHVLLMSRARQHVCQSLPETAARNSSWIGTGSRQAECWRLRVDTDRHTGHQIIGLSYTARKSSIKMETEVLEDSILNIISLFLKLILKLYFRRANRVFTFYSRHLTYWLRLQLPEYISVFPIYPFQFKL